MQGAYFARPATFQGVSAAGNIHLFASHLTSNLRPLNLSSDSPLVKAPADYFNRDILWSEYDPAGLRDPLLGATNPIVIPINFRHANRPTAATWLTFGAHSGFQTSINSIIPGNNVYDYRWRALNAEDLTEHMGLPLSLTLVDRQGL